MATDAGADATTVATATAAATLATVCAIRIGPRASPSLAASVRFAPVIRMPAWNASRPWFAVDEHRFAQSVQQATTATRFVRLDRYACEDLPLAMLIDFAARAGLPVRIVNGSGVFDSRSSQFSNPLDFANVVLRRTGASDLGRVENSQELAATPAQMLALARPGDIYLLGTRPTWGHCQVVRSVSPQRVEILQGNKRTQCGPSAFDYAVKHSAGYSNHPQGLCYYGSEIQRGVYDRRMGTYQRDGDDVRDGPITLRGMLVRWNFRAFARAG